MHLLAYGEDALTLWALTQRMPEFLSKIGDDSVPADVLALHRPSFGRRGGGSEHASVPRRRSQFGEFDAIVATPQATYLIESKWSRSGEIEGDSLVVSGVQQWRHEVMRWYIQRWRQVRPDRWVSFADATRTEFRERFPTMDLPSEDRALAGNLEYVLRLLERAGEPIVDVLLFACAPGQKAPSRIEPPGFHLVCLDHPLLGGAGFIELTLGAPSPPSRA